MTCAALETIAAWALDELDEPEAEAFEAHYFGCSTCFHHAQRLLELVQALRVALPAVLTTERRHALEARGSGLVTAHVKPGQKALIRLGESQPLGIWCMHCDLHGVSRVDLEGRTPDGEMMFRFADVPFDTERGLVAMPCHFHFYRMPGAPPLFHTRLTSHEPEGPRLLAEYVLDHEFENV